MLKAEKMPEPDLSATDAHPRNQKPSRKKIQSVERALAILEVLAGAKGEVALRELALAVGLNKSTCHNILGTLIDHGYVGQSARARTYFLGNKIIELSGSRISQFDLVDLAMPYLRKLNDVTGETVHLAALQGDELITLTQLDSHHAVRVVSGNVGKTEAIHATATGKAILAWLPETEISRILDRKGQPSFTDNTITSRARLIEDLRHVRRTGCAVDNEEFQPGVVCVGAAIRNHTGGVVGAFSCSLPAMRADADHIAMIERNVRETSRILSETLGGADAGDPEIEQG